MPAQDFGGGPVRVLRGHAGHPEKARRVLLARGLARVIGAGGHRFGFADVEQRMDPRRGQREDRLVNAGGVHVGDAPLAQVEQALEDPGGALGQNPHSDWVPRSALPSLTIRR